MLNELLIGVGLSLMLGALIGIQRETRQQKNHKKDFAGFRTYTFISLLGFLIGYLAQELNETLIIALSIISIFTISIIAYYVLSKKDPQGFRMASEITFILTFILGIFISLKYYHFAITLSVIITTILVLGNRLHHFAKALKKDEIFATLKFAIMSIVILPILPNKNFTPLEIPIIGKQLTMIIPTQILTQLNVFNLYQMWLMVIFISGIGFIGYILIKTVGAQKGIFMTGFLGGFMSSTALTTSFSQESKKYPIISNPLAIGVIIACSTMFFRIIFEISVLNPNLLNEISINLLIMGIIGFATTIYIYLKHKNDKYNMNKQNFTSPFTLKPALKFAILYVGILFFSKLFTILNGDKGIYLLSFISGISDVDAITISLSKLALDNSISSYVAQNGILIAAMSNTLFKGIIAFYFGSKNFFLKVTLAFGLIILIGSICLLI